MPLSSIAAADAVPRSACPTAGFDAPLKRAVQFTGRDWLVLACILASLLPWGAHLRAQWSEDPSDATPSLLINTLSPAPSLSAAEPGSCALPACQTNTGANFTLGLATSATLPATSGIPYPPCQVEQTITPVMPFKDIWYRLDPLNADDSYRFTLYGTGTPSMTRGGIAVYEAPNASGPFRLLDCSLGGNPETTISNNLPSVEANCITAGYKLYIRVWDRTAPSGINSYFSIGVMGQRRSLMPDRGADETPCSARQVVSSPTFTTAGATINYTYACDEGGLLPTTPEKTGGDLWVKLQVPASGVVIIKSSFATSSTNMIGSGSSPITGSFGTSAYLATDCSDYGTFREVGSVATLVTPAGSTASSANLVVRCLPAGAWLYVRFYALKEATTGTKIRRFGQFRFEWMAGSATGTPPANCDPCSAPAVTVGTNALGAACTNPVSGTTYAACNFPGLPAPLCGNFSNATGSVWYKFIAPVSGLVVIDAAPGGAPATQPAIALYTTNDSIGDPGDGCGTRMNLVSCDDRQGPGPNARIIQGGLRPGQIYYVRVFTRNEGTNPTGNFTLCISSPAPPAGSCWYMIDLYCKATTGKLGMYATIPAGGSTVSYFTSGNDPSESFLVAIPAGAAADFQLITNPATGVGVTQYYFWGLWQMEGSDTLWYGDGGYAVAGPTAGPNDQFHLTNACMRRPRPRTDCMGMQTLCITAPGSTHFAGQMDTRGWPIREYSSAQTDYLGYTYHPNRGGSYDLAGDNMGCLEGETNGIQWLVFHPTADGTVAFVIDGSKVYPAPTTRADLDFAVWDLGTLAFQGTTPDSLNGDRLCPPKSPPVRCSSSRAALTTGLAAGMSPTQEGHGGWGWVAPLPVQNGHGYLVAITAPLDLGRINYSFDWTLYKNASGTTDPSIISCQPLLLPVELLFLAGLPNGNQVDLTWATASEKNSSHFLVQRSSNGSDFYTIGRVAAAGNSQQRIDYTFTDTDPFTGVNYYRLKLVDLDGRTDVSNVIAVAFDGPVGKVMVFPNPVSDLLNLMVETAGQTAVTLRILDATGRLVRAEQAQVEGGRQVLQLTAETLAPGAYMVHVSTAAGTSLATARFVKE